MDNSRESYKLDLSKETDQLIKDLALEINSSVSSVYTLAIALFTIFVAASKQGGELYVHTKDGEQRRITLEGLTNKEQVDG